MIIESEMKSHRVASACTPSPLQHLQPPGTTFNPPAETVQYIDQNFIPESRTYTVHAQGRSLPLIYTEAGGLGAAPQKLYTIFHQKYELVTQILVLNNKNR